MKKITFFICGVLSYAAYAIELQEHEKWWQEHWVGEQHKTGDNLNTWIGGENESSRVAARLHIFLKRYESVLDIPCGGCADYRAFKKNSRIKHYKAADITQSFINDAIEKGIDAEQASIEKIPLSDNTFDVTYSRHILEHLSSYEKALQELVRVAKREVIVIFFMAPHDNKNHVISNKLHDGYPLYHNSYSKPLLEKFLSELPKVDYYEWESCMNEVILHIYLKS